MTTNYKCLIYCPYLDYGLRYNSPGSGTSNNPLVYKLCTTRFFNSCNIRQNVPNNDISGLFYIESYILNNGMQLNIQNTSIFTYCVTSRGGDQAPQAPVIQGKETEWNIPRRILETTPRYRLNLGVYKRMSSLYKIHTLYRTVYCILYTVLYCTVLYCTVPDHNWERHGKYCSDQHGVAEGASETVLSCYPRCRDLQSTQVTQLLQSNMWGFRAHRNTGQFARS